MNDNPIRTPINSRYGRRCAIRFKGTTWRVKLHKDKLILWTKAFGNTERCYDARLACHLPLDAPSNRARPSKEDVLDFIAENYTAIMNDSLSQTGVRANEQE